MANPKILIYDIETCGVNALRSDLGFIICFGYKWVGAKTTYCLTLDQFGTLGRERFIAEKKMLKMVLSIIEKADIVVGHYSSVFDRRFFQGRCAIHGLTPPPFTKMRDTCLIARSAFNFSSNRLGHLSKILKLKHEKQSKGWPDWWFGVLSGDVSALHKIAKYCKGDVRATEELYLRERPFDNTHPRMYTDDKCRVCGGAVQHRGTCFIGERQYRRWQCTKCGKWDRARKAL